MSQLADINDDFGRAINNGVGSEEDLLRLKMSLFESLEWQEDAWLVADTLISKGFAVESYHTRNFGA